jgi:recombinational DNA repair protein RecT
MSEIQKSENKVSFKDLTEQLSKAPNIKSAMTIPFVQDQFIKIYSATTGKQDGSYRFQQELLALLEITEEKPDLKKLDKFFHFSALIQVARTGLSLRDNKLYLIPKGGGLKVQASPAGKREQLEKMKTVKQVPEPILVMKGDLFLVDKLNGTVIKHEETEKTVHTMSLENIVAAYTRIYFKDGTIKDVIVRHDDLKKAKSKSQSQSEGSFWNQWPGEACKKVSINRAFRLYHKYDDSVAVLFSGADVEDREDGTEDSYSDAQVVNHGNDQVDADSGEVITPETIDEPKRKSSSKDEDFA